MTNLGTLALLAAIIATYRRLPIADDTSLSLVASGIGGFARSETGAFGYP